MKTKPEKPLGKGARLGFLAAFGICLVAASLLAFWPETPKEPQAQAQTALKAKDDAQDIEQEAASDVEEAMSQRDAATAAQVCAKVYDLQKNYGDLTAMDMDQVLKDEKVTNLRVPWGFTSKDEPREVFWGTRALEDGTYLCVFYVNRPDQAKPYSATTLIFDPSQDGFTDGKLVRALIEDDTLGDMGTRDGNQEIKDWMEENYPGLGEDEHTPYAMEEAERITEEDRTKSLIARDEARYVAEEAMKNGEDPNEAVEKYFAQKNGGQQ